MLLQITKMIQERQTADINDAIRIAVASGHGVGKTALLVWIVLWFISTRVAPIIVVTANTESQLTNVTWRELAKWHKLMVIQDWFQWTATKFYLKERPEDHFAIAQPWTKERSQAFAGRHESRGVLMIFDEASTIDDIIWEVAQGAMTTPGAFWFVFGNPTRNTGRFRECWGKLRHRWWTMRVDSRKARKAHQDEIKTWIEDYGEDSDLVRVRVKGEFPRAASNQLIPLDMVEDAMKRQPPPANDDEPKILAVDIARYGDDDTVVGMRQGQKFTVVARYNGLDLEQVAFRVAQHIRDLNPDAVFVDEVGMGAGPVDRLRGLGFEVEGVNGGLRAGDDRHYFNKRAEMWDGVRNWLRHGGCLPPKDERLRDDLIGPEYGFDNKGRIQLEKKEDMKARGLHSPDAGDTLSMTFYMPVAKRESRTAAMARLLQQESAGTWMSH